MCEFTELCLLYCFENKEGVLRGLVEYTVYICLNFNLILNFLSYICCDSYFYMS